MHLLYCDETNLEERSGDFFAYGGLSIDSEVASALSDKIGAIRKEAGVDQKFKLKFKPRPDGLEHAKFNVLKQRIVEAAVEHGAKFLATAILHDIATSPNDARRNGINTICFHFDSALNRLKTPGLILIDRFNDAQIDDHLVEKFSVGVRGLPFTSEYRLTNVVGVHYSAVGQSHFPSVIDIVLGSFRFAVNAFTRNEVGNLKTASLLLKMISPLFFREKDKTSVSEIGLMYSPKTVKSDKFKAQYIALQSFLSENDIVTAQSFD